MTTKRVKLSKSSKPPALLLKDLLQHQVDHIMKDPNVPNDVKIMVQNFAGLQYHSYVMHLDILENNQNRTLSKFSDMGPT